MPPPWVALDVIPSLGRPAEVENAIGEAAELRDRARQAQESTAQAQAQLEQAEREDVAAAAAKARAGAALGAEPAAVKKARDRLHAAQREAAALQLAADGAAADLAETMGSRSEPWIAALGEEAEQGKVLARQALAQLEDALGQIAAAGSAVAWLSSAVADSRYDRPQRTMLAGSTAPTSARITANSQPIGVGQLVAFIAEAIDPPAPTRPPTLETAAPRPAA